MIKLTGINKIYRTNEIETVALENVNLEVNKGEFLSIMGPSGCGKSTLLNIMGLLDAPTSGTIEIAGTKVDGMKDKELAAFRNQKLGFVFQSFHLINSLNVLDNVELPLLYRKVSAKERRHLAEEVLKKVGLSHRMRHMPTQLSGGQCQRVAIARALVNRPKVLLLDEPLGALDLRLRKDMQNELKRIQQAMGITFIYVTHDQEEALSMSDTVVVMDKGRIQQIGTPEDIYNEPKNAFVADFIGESNILDGIMLEDRLVKFFGRKFKCVDFGFEKNEPVDVVIRPEDIDIVAPDDGHLCGTVTSVTFKGVHYDTIVDFKGFKWLIQTTDFYEVGSYIGIRLEPEDIHIMHKSEYSGMFGDYSSYSAEYDEMDDPDLYPEDAEESEEASEGGEDEE